MRVEVKAGPSRESGPATTTAALQKQLVSIQKQLSALTKQLSNTTDRDAKRLLQQQIQALQQQVEMIQEQMKRTAMPPERDGVKQALSANRPEMNNGMVGSRVDTHA
ncbi:FlxA-like family protein [Variovorax sp. J22P271]|uniref:FlxA-like family protein n=1 Tax=Variovorax davisae TaxID=3053515 RepID=UPI002576DF1F|nr:FlxA-like family protein [Variovorax sp. J22P271]MDM0032480.1 FlxA-like family protein [Variovorax sp. J22P271]